MFSLRSSWKKHGRSAICEDQYVEALEYAIQHGYPVSYDTTAGVEANGAIKSLQVILENGHLDCLKYLHDNGCS